MELESVLPTCDGQIRVFFIAMQRREGIVNGSHN
jgi:hypothetical protein